jgi:hypothetical protein
MPLCRVEELTLLLNTWGYDHEPRMHWCAKEFRDCTELLVLSLLYNYGVGHPFTLCSLCVIYLQASAIHFSMYSLMR